MLNKLLNTYKNMFRYENDNEYDYYYYYLLNLTVQYYIILDSERRQTV